MLDSRPRLRAGLANQVSSVVRQKPFTLGNSNRKIISNSSKSIGG